MIFSVAMLWRVRHEMSHKLPEIIGIVAFVLIAQWFLNRFSGSKRWIARVALYSTLGALITGATAAFKFLLVQNGYQESKSLAEGLVAVTLFVACFAVSLWSFLRLRKASPA